MERWTTGAVGRVAPVGDGRLDVAFNEVLNGVLTAIESVPESNDVVEVRHLLGRIPRGMVVVNTTVGTQWYRLPGDAAWTAEVISFRMAACIHELALDAPVGPVSLVQDIGAGSLSAGTYQYRFAFWDSTHGVESPVGDFTSQITVSAGDGVTVGTGSALLPTTTQRFVDKVRIYRTKADGSIFYYLVEVNNGDSSYSDTAADSGLSEQVDVWPGYAPPESRRMLVFLF